MRTVGEECRNRVKRVQVEPVRSERFELNRPKGIRLSEPTSRDKNRNDSKPTPGHNSPKTLQTTSPVLFPSSKLLTPAFLIAGSSPIPEISQILTSAFHRCLTKFLMASTIPATWFLCLAMARSTALEAPGWVFGFWMARPSFSPLNFKAAAPRRTWSASFSGSLARRRGPE